MGLKGDSLLPDCPQRGKGKNLKSARIGQRRTRPAGKAFESPLPFYDLIAGAHMQMIGITQHNLTVQFLQVKRRNTAFDRGCSGDIHKSRGLERAIHSGEGSAACPPLLFQ